MALGTSLLTACGGSSKPSASSTATRATTSTATTSSTPPAKTTTAPAATTTGGAASTTPAPAHGLVVGAVEDGPKYGNGPGKAKLARAAGFRALVFSTVWKPPLTQPEPAELASLRGAVRAAVGQDIEPIVAVYGFSGTTPLTDDARSQFAQFAASIPRLIPDVRTVSVGNEPNLNLFWMPQFGSDGSDAAASAYVRLLADSYDAIKAVSPDVRVIGGSLAARGSDDPHGSRPTHSPTRFIEDMGAAYRASGRTKPLFDLFSVHPYPEDSSVPPTFAHPHTTSIGLADYGKLSTLLQRAFGSVPPIVYGEYGIQSRESGGSYTGTEQPTIHAVDEATQARDYREAIHLAACQPKVAMLLFFHVFDEAELERLQTGVYRADLSPKPSLRSVADAPLTCSS